jgi:hypothetical protein
MQVLLGSPGMSQFSKWRKERWATS